MGDHDLAPLILHYSFLPLPLFCSFYPPNTGHLSAHKHVKFTRNLGIGTAFFLCLECSLLRCTAWLSPFHHLDFKFLERPTLTTLMLLSSCPRHTCNNLFYFSPNTYNSFYLYTCLWSVFPSNLFRAVSSATR